MTYTLPRSATSILVKDLAKNFSKSLDSLIKREISISYGNGVLNLDSLDSLRLIYEHVSKTDTERIFKNFLIKNFSDAERVCSGSGIIATISFLKSMSINHDAEKSLHSLKKLSTSSSRGNKDNLNTFLEQLIIDKKLLKVAKKIIDDGGFNAACSIETTYNLSDQILINEACVFNVHVDRDFSSIVKQNEFKKSNSNIIVADGVIEEISEIHHLLEHFAENKEFCFMICRGYGKNVISTLATNFARNSLNVIPGVLVHDVESINSLKDICVISNMDLLSTLKGDKFSNIDLKTVSKVETLTLNQQCLEINNPAEYPRVVTLIKNLRKQIQEEFVQDKIDLLEKRIASLSPRKMRILFSNHEKDSVGIKKDRLKIIISMINDYCQNGKIDIGYQEEDEVINSVLSSIKKNGISTFPARCFLEGCHVGLKNAKIIKNTGQIILIDS